MKNEKAYLIESLFVESLMVESPAIWVDVESVADIVEVLSVTVVDDSLVSVFVLEQPVANAITANRKKADFTMS